MFNKCRYCRNVQAAATVFSILFPEKIMLMKFIKLLQTGSETVANVSVKVYIMQRGNLEYAGI